MKYHFAVFVGILLLFVLTLQPASGQTFTVLHNFTGPDGQVVYSTLIMDPAGNLYGTTVGGGNSAGYGTVFKIDTSGNEQVLHSFQSNNIDGGEPYAGVIIDSAGNLYGTTTSGYPYGSVFKVDTSGNETAIYTFTDLNGDGAFPYGGLLMDASGDLYGTTTQGGASAAGTIFKLDSAGNETVLYGGFTIPNQLNPNSTGASPQSTLVSDSLGNLYGTATQGGLYNFGTVFKLDTAGNITVLHNFQNNGDGIEPVAGVIRDNSGNLYGTTYFGGAHGGGTVFKIDSSGNETLLYNFGALPNYGDGADPRGGVIMDASGNLYGTTEGGGSNSYGTVWKLDMSGNETILHSFQNSDGASPGSSLLMDSVGNLYGTTEVGGSAGAGTVFEIAMSNFSVSPTPSSETVKAGKAATYTLTITPIGGFTGQVSLSCSDQVPVSTCAISPPSVMLNGSSPSNAAVSISTSAGKKGTSKGTFMVTLTGISGALSHSATVALTVR